jgi:hypothetical protein
MPILIATLVLAVLFGLFAPSRVAVVLTAVAAGFTAFAFIWAVADGKGDDPWWLVLVGTGGGVLAILICLWLTGRRAPKPVGART